MSNLNKILFFCSAAIIFASSGLADTIYFGESPNGAVYGTSELVGLNPWVVSESAWLFAANQNYELTSVTVEVSALQGFAYPPASLDFDIWLYSSEEIVNPGGLEGIAPNAPIAEIGENLVAPSAPGLVTSYASSGIPLTAGEYWIVLTPANPYSLVEWTTSSDSMQVYGTPLTSAAAPEPATMTLFALALIGLPFVRQRSGKDGDETA